MFIRNKTSKKQTTNLGEFAPEKVGGPYVTDRDKRWAKQLVDNGEFEECDAGGGSLGDAPNTKGETPVNPDPATEGAAKKTSKKASKKVKTAE